MHDFCVNHEIAINELYGMNIDRILRNCVCIILIETIRLKKLVEHSFDVCDSGI